VHVTAAFVGGDIMHDTEKPVHKTTDVSKALLNIYECTISPDKYSALTISLGSVLETSHDGDVLENIENHSETIWPTLTENISPCFDAHSAHPPQFQSAHAKARDTDPQDLQDFLSNIYPSDTKRLEGHLSHQDDVQETIVRVATSTDAKTLLYLVRITDGLLNFYPMTNSIEAEVEKLIVDSFNISNSEMAVLHGLVAGRSIKAIAHDRCKSV